MSSTLEMSENNTENPENPLLTGNLSEAKQTLVKYANLNKRYYSNIMLSLSMATYITIFGLPVYSAYLSWSIFGEKHRFIGGEYVSTCGENMMGPKVNVGTDTEPVLVNFNSTFVAEGREMYAWCGFLPGSYFTAWPAVVQTAFFTVFMNTGSTVKLAWQCIAGTFTAILNIYFLNLLFPGGAASEDYIPAVAWIDLVLILFLYLASKADINTMKMGMNWTVCLMMHFMNPNTGSTLGTYKTFIPGVHWDGETTIVMLTSIMGCILAIVATTFPRPLLNISNVHDDAAEVTKGIDAIFQESIDYWAGKDMGPRRFQIFSKMKALTSATKRVQNNLDESFWETFNLCQFGRMRRLYASYNKAIQSNSDEIYMVKAALETIDFNETHAKFATKVKGSLQKLKDATMDCLNMCTACCKDGVITDEEKKAILEKVATMDHRQQDLSNQYQVAKQDLPYVSTDLAADSLFVFSVSQWAKELGDFGRDLANFEDRWKDAKYSSPVMGLAMMAVNQTKSVLDPGAMFEKEQLRYTVINIIPILITYVIAMEMDCSVFVRYASTMPGVLTLLVSYDYGATFFQNAQRLMGTVFGQTIPLLIMGVIGLMPCDSWVRFVVHMTSIFAFYFAFTFMYYSSDQWATIGCCIAGFGVYPIFHQCDPSVGKIDYSAQYKGIAEVIVAILLKMAVASALAPAEPRDNAMTSLEKLTTSIKDAYKIFITAGEGNDGVAGLKKCRDDVRKYLAECEDILPKCDPSLQLVPGSRTPFKHELFGQALGQLKLMLSDLDMIVLAMTGHETTHTEDAKLSMVQVVEEAQEKKEDEAQEKKLHDFMSEQPAWKTIVKDMFTTIETILDMLTVVLAHDTEEPLEDGIVDRLKNMERILELAGVEKFYAELSEAQKGEVKEDKAIFDDNRTITELKRTRLTVAINAFALSVKHVGAISAQCFNHMIYA